MVITNSDTTRDADGYLILTAPPNRFRVVLVDYFDPPGPDAGFVLGDCEDQETAVKLAKAHNKDFVHGFVYDDSGRRVFSTR
jgi:hypothetical protein